MDYEILSILNSILFIVGFLLATYLLIPKSVEYWHQWKKTGKSIHLSNAAAAAVGALFLLIAVFFIFIRPFRGI